MSGAAYEARRTMPAAGANPQVSVILPAYRAENYLEDAVSSVLRQEVPLELLIIDDASPDGTGDLAERLAACSPEKIRVFHNAQDLGAAQTRNIGIRAARGTYIAFLDADDWWADGKLTAQVALLQETGRVLCGTGRELMNPDGSSTGRTIGMPPLVTYEELLKGNVISCSSVLMQAGPAKEFEMQRDDLHEDYILWLNVLKKYGPAAGINEPLLKSRLSEGGKSRNKRKSAQMTWGVYRYMGIGRIRALWYFMHYMLQGVRKYYG